MIRLKDLLNETEEFQQLPTELKKHFLEIISTYNQHREGMSRKSDIMQIAETLGGIADAAQEYTLREGGDWFDRVTIKRNMNELKKLQSGFEKEAVEAKSQQQRLEALYEDMGHVLGRYFDMQEISDEDADFRLGKRPPKMEQSSKLSALMPQNVSEDQGPCWKGYKQIGMKDKGGRQVPNCVPNESVVKENKSDCGCNEQHDCGCGGHHKH